MGKNYYETLQVSRDAEDAVIRASYKALVQKYHPDKYQPREDAERLTAALNEAYANLSDPELRKAHDDYLDFIKEREYTPPPKQENQSAPYENQESPKPKKFGLLTWIWLLIVFSFLSVLGRLAVEAVIGNGILAAAFGTIAALAGTTAYAWIWEKLDSQTLRLGAGVATLFAISIAALVIRAGGELLHKSPQPSYSTQQTPSQPKTELDFVDPFAQSTAADGEQASATQSNPSVYLTPVEGNPFSSTQASAKPPAHEDGPWTKFKPITASSSAKQTDWSQSQQVEPAPAIQISQADQWHQTVTAWERRHADFLADPARRQVMNEVLDELESQTPRLSDDELLRRAQALAFFRTDWQGQ